MVAYRVRSWPKGAREGDIPYHAEYSDGSEYHVVWLDEHSALRRFSGPLFKAEVEVREVLAWSLSSQ